MQDLFGNLQEYMEEWAVGAASLADGATGATPFLIDSDEVFNLAGRIHHIGDALAQGHARG